MSTIILSEDRRKGTPRTDEERRERHHETYGKWLDVLPERRTGLGAYQVSIPTTLPELKEMVKNPWVWIVVIGLILLLIRSKR